MNKPDLALNNRQWLICHNSPRKNATWLLYKNLTYCFKHIIETALYKIAVILLFNSYFTNYTRKTYTTRKVRTNP